MIVSIQIATIIVLGIIFYQDFKNREVTGILFLFTALFMGILHFKKVPNIVFVYNCTINLVLIASILFILFIYSKYKMKVSFFKEAFGLGDLLFFIVFAIGFPSHTFVILFVFSLIFSLTLSVFFKLKSKQKTVPLAGFMSLFLIVIYVCSWSTNAFNLYFL